MNLGRIGVWRRHQPGPGIVPELEALGYDALWLGSSPSLAQARPYLEASEEITIATGILNIWQHEPADVAAQHVELTRAFPGSFLLGIGVGHPEATSDYTRPLSAMRAFFDGLEGVPRDERLELGHDAGTRLVAAPDAETADAGLHGEGRGPCSASKCCLTSPNALSARSSVARSCVAITLVRSRAPPGGTAGCSATLTNTPAS